MLKYVAVVCVLVALCAGAPQQNPQDVQLLRYDSNTDIDGYSFAFETSDGTSRQEEGKIDNPQSEDAALTVNGQYSFVAPNGKQYSVTFIAGPDGFQPKVSMSQK